MAKEESKNENISELDELGYARQVYQNQYALVNNSTQMMRRRCANERLAAHA